MLYHMASPTAELFYYVAVFKIFVKNLLRDFELHLTFYDILHEFKPHQESSRQYAIAVQYVQWTFLVNCEVSL